MDAKGEGKSEAAKRYKAGVLKYAQMGYWNGDYVPGYRSHRLVFASRRRTASIRSEAAAAVAGEILDRRHGRSSGRID